MKKFFTSIPNLLLSVVLCFVLSSCSSTGVKMNETSPWKTIQFEDQANALDVDFIDDNHGFLVGSNRLIMESTDGGETWEKRSLDISAEENLVYGFGFNSLPPGQKNILIFGGLAFAAAMFLSLYSLH